MGAGLIVNGQPADSLPLTDRGLQYGDGLFETMRWQNGAVQFWDDHYARLQKGCQQLGIPCPDKELLDSELRKLIDNARALAEPRVIKFILTRGSGGRGYKNPDDVKPTRIFSLHPFPDYPEKNYSQGVRLRLCETRLAKNPALAGIKHLNRLEQVLARNEWQTDEFAEGLMLDQDEHVIEATMSNVFWLKGEKIFTPSVEQCGIAGIMRGKILQIAEDLNFDTEVGEYNLDDLLTSGGVFLSNSILGIWPVSNFMDKHWTPHPVIQSLTKKLLS